MTVADTYRLSSRYTDDTGTVFMTGLQALARLPIEQLRADRRAGLNTAAFASGYPGSPLGGYDGELSSAVEQARDLPIVHRPAVNEELAVTAVMGSQLASLRPDSRYDGVVGIFYGKAPGVDRAADALRHAVFAGSDPRGGAVVIAGDDPAAKSSTLPSSSAGSLADKQIPVFYPGTAGEALELGRHAVHMSRVTGLWTSLKIVADVADGAETVQLDPQRVAPVVPTIDGEPYVHIPDGSLLTPETVDTEREIYEIRHRLAIEYAALNRLNHATVDPPDAWIGIVASGITYLEVREALRRLGLKHDSEISAAGIRLLRMNMPIPFSAQRARHFARGLEEIFVIEEKQPNIESLMKDALYNQTLRPRVIGKYDERDAMLLAGHGMLASDDLISPLRRRLSERIGARLAPERAPRELIPLGTAVARTPYFCSGCPHNRSTRVPEGAVVGAGIGCHTMTLLMDSEEFGDILGLTCMGQEGAQWIGMSPFVGTPHIFQNLGDGTYFHSGQLAVQAAVSAGVDVTYKLLWNRAVAMTGGQDPQGATGVPQVCRVLLAQGVARVMVTTEDVARYRRSDMPDGVDVWPRSRLMEAQELLAATRGVTVLIHDQQCAAEARRGRKRGTAAVPRQRVFINERICEGCGDCASVSNCLSVQPVSTAFGRKTRIDQTTCNLDFSCLEGDCPSFVTVTRPGRLGTWLRKLTRRSGPAPDGSAAAPLAAPADLDEPELIVPSDDLSIRILGIGGTGVVTVSQIIGTAAMLDGAEARTLDQIGLSQKAGPVVSDLRLCRSHADGAETAPRESAASNRLGRGQADVLLAFDQLGAASQAGLSSTDPESTVVVGSTSQTPTGAMVAHPDRAMPSPEELEAAIASVTRPGGGFWADAGAITDALLGSSVTANVFVVGMAVQAGALPLSPLSVEQAIELNGVAIRSNLEAFRWGRAVIARPAEVEAAVAAAGTRRAGRPEREAPVNQTRRSLGGAERLAEVDASLAARAAALADLLGEAAAADGYSEALDLELLAAELCAFQSPALAHQHLDFVEEVAAADAAHGDGSRRLTTAAARGYFKLLAYKDEYEVARLMLDPEANAEARALAESNGGRLAWKLHPPVLRAMGMRAKISVPVSWTPLMRLLAAMRRLRGTPLDLFGYARVRRAERALPKEYRAAVSADLERLDTVGYETALARAELPEMVRGYEHIKMAGVERFRQALAQQ
ncbi:MAG: indolepyruvate ferredoxin oxidoreductase family protein [Acidimicrobiaceae bacterium]|nr:indolepyruvate ferredoxin oxidoreductase family protein [Acidimicrobiaceae bacterium]